jgi:hypothetical protein
MSTSWQGKAPGGGGLLALIGEVLGSNLGKEIGYNFLSLVQTLQANERVVPRLRHGLFLSNDYKLSFRRPCIRLPKAS